MNVFHRLCVVVPFALAAIGFADVSADVDQRVHVTGYRSPLCSEGLEPAVCTTKELRRDFMMVVERGNKDDVLRLLKKLKDKNLLNAIDGYSPLGWAIEKGKSDVVAMLLESGADPLAVDRHGMLALYGALIAAYTSLPELPSEVVKCVRLVLENASRTGRMPPTPPLDASIVFFRDDKKPNLELLKLFIKYGADPSRESRYFRRGSPLDTAINKNELEAVRIMIAPGSHVTPRELDEKAFSALIKQKTELLRIFHSAGANPTRHIDANPKILFDAARPEGSVAMLELLLKNGANPNAIEREGSRRTPIFVTGFDPEKMALLFKYGADPNIKDDGYTLLGKVLFHYGKEIPVTSSEEPGKAPRIYSKVALVNLLLDHGAGMNANNGGWGQWGALGLTRREDKEVIDLLVKRGATLSREIGKLALFPQLKDKYESAARDDKAPGPITIAVDILERDDLALVLLARDGKVGPQDRLALLQAARRGWREVAQELLRVGADPNVADVGGLTPLAMAERRRDESLIRMLVAAGAKPPPQPAPRYKIDASGEFENAVATEIDDVVFLDPPRFYLNWPKETPFILYGKQKTERGQGFEQVKCERSVTFTIIVNAGISGGISAGICTQEAERLRKLALAAEQSIDTLLGQLAQGGVKFDQLDRKKLDWIYEKRAGPNQSEIYYFPLIIVGHGVLSASTVVLTSESGDKAIIVQADVMKLCGEGHNMQNQTPLCGDTKGAITDVAQRLFTRFGQE